MDSRRFDDVHQNNVVFTAIKRAKGEANVSLGKQECFCESGYLSFGR